MKTLLVNFDKIVDPRIDERISQIDAKCVIGNDFKFITELENNYEKIVILIDERNLNFVSLLDILKDDKELNNKFYIIINASDFNEEVEEYIEDVIDIIFDFVEGVLIEDKDDLNKFILNYLE